MRLFSARDSYAMMKENVYEGELVVWDSFPKWFFIVPMSEKWTARVVCEGWLDGKYMNYG